MRYRKRLLRAGKLLQAGIRLQRTLSGAWAPPATRKPSQSARHGPLIEPGRFVAHVYRNRAGQRHYKVYTPAHFRPGVPLVVMLHGCSQSPDDFAVATRMNALAEELGFVVVYPAQSSRANPANCWNWFEALHQQRDEGEPSLIAGITRRILKQGLDERRVYIAGHSAGGAMAAVMAAEYPDLYAAVGVHSGLPHGVAQDLPSALAAMNGRASGRHEIERRGVGARHVPIIAFHGDEDTTVHPRNSDFATATGARVAAERGERNGRAFTRTLHFDARNRPMVEHWIVHGAGHAWFGADPRGSFADPLGPDATREMLRFFFSHTR
jgi:poly(hydroxyalkanoate) depolymerase family esterase